MISHWKSRRKGHHQGSNTGLWERPLWSHYKAVARSWEGGFIQNKCARKGTASLAYAVERSRFRGPGELARVTWPETSVCPPSLGLSPLSSLGRCLSCCQGVYGLESLKASVPTGLLHCLVQRKSQPLSASQSSHL